MRSKWFRAIVLGGLSALLVPISWTLTLFVTFGFAVVHFWLSTQPSSFLGHLNEGVAIAGAVDFAVWFGALWSAHGLWIRLRREMREPNTTRNYSSPLLNAGTLVRAMLLAIPFSYYVLLGAMVLWNHSRLPEPAGLFAIAMVLSVAICGGAISGAYALVVKRARDSAARRKNSSVGGGL